MGFYYRGQRWRPAEYRTLYINPLVLTATKEFSKQPVTVSTSSTIAQNVPGLLSPSLTTRKPDIEGGVQGHGGSSDNYRNDSQIHEHRNPE